MSAWAWRARARRGVRSLSRDTRGVVSIEFGVVVGLIIIVVFATLQLGRALAAQNEMSHALGRVARVTQLDTTTTPESIVGLLEQYLEGFDERELDVGITEIAGTSFMEISVAFPYTISIPLIPETDVTLRVATRAPMVSPTQ